MPGIALFVRPPGYHTGSGAPFGERITVKATYGGEWYVFDDFQFELARPKTRREGEKDALNLLGFATADANTLLFAKSPPPQTRR